MKKKRICLFTAHSPTSGGGGAILRSLIENLSELSVIWCYTGHKASGYAGGYIGKSVMGGNMIMDIISSFKMLNGLHNTAVNNVVDKLLEVSCDGYWIVSHNEGLRVAFELTRRQNTRPVHLTVHDDWGGALAPQSVRYRLFANAADKLTIKTLQSVSSFDVISRGMQNYYKDISGLTGEVCHRYIPARDINFGSFKPETNVTIGHIGRLYTKSSLISLIKILKKFYETKGITPLVKLWGCHLNIGNLPAHLRNNVCFYPTASEADVIPQLANCDMLYAMYPFEEHLAVFAQTSLPTKLTSYLQAGRPILAHCPRNSTLAEFIDTTGLGVIWDSNDESAGAATITKLSSINLTTDQLLNARTQYFGENNLNIMKLYLSDNTEPTA